MKKMTSKRIMAIFIGVVMLASIAEVALLRNTPGDTPGTVNVPNVVNRKLTLDELRTTLGSGKKVLIEYFYNESCADCGARADVYKSFVVSSQFSDFAVLSYGVSGNDTADWMLDATGTQINLDNVTSVGDLQKLLCSDGVRLLDKPNVCILDQLENG
jgi:hypothetical protein